MTNKSSTDRDLLTKKAYVDDEMLKIRQLTHELYSVPKLNFSEWVLNRVAWRGDEHVLDIGSGPGTYFETVRNRIATGRLSAGDLSLGMARKAQQHAHKGDVYNLDVQSLPFSNG